MEPVYAGYNGFLGTRASLMLDLVFLAMFAILPVLAFSIYLVRNRRAYQLHKRLQLGIGIVLAAAVSLFEIDMRVHGWTDRAAASPYYGTAESPGLVHLSLYIHLFFAISTSVLWIVVIARALRHFPDPPVPGPHSASHKTFGWLAAIDLAATSLTGWIFYWLAFAAT